MLTIRSGCQLNHAVAFTTCKNYTHDGTHLMLTRHEYGGNVARRGAPVSHLRAVGAIHEAAEE